MLMNRPESLYIVTILITIMNLWIKIEDEKDWWTLWSPKMSTLDGVGLVVRNSERGTTDGRSQHTETHTNMFVQIV